MRRAIRVRFSTLHALDGWEVVADDTGRPVTKRPTLAEANGVAQALNRIPAADLGRAIGRLRK